MHNGETKLNVPLALGKNNFIDKRISMSVKDSESKRDRFNIGVVDSLLEDFVKHYNMEKTPEHMRFMTSDISVLEKQFLYNLLDCITNKVEADNLFESYKLARIKISREDNYLGMLRKLTKLSKATNNKIEKSVFDEFKSLTFKLISSEGHKYKVGIKPILSKDTRIYDEIDFNEVDKIIDDYCDYLSKEDPYRSFAEFLADTRGRYTWYAKDIITELFKCKQNCNKKADVEYIVEQYKSIRSILINKSKPEEIIRTLLETEIEPDLNMTNINIIRMFEIIALNEFANGNDLDMSIKKDIIDIQNKGNKAIKNKAQIKNVNKNSKLSKTHDEIVFLASAYYDSSKFIIASGFSNIKAINLEFENRVFSYVRSGKINRESYEAFKNTLRKLGYPLGNDKEAFIKLVESKFNKDEFIMSRDLEKFKQKFDEMIKSCNIIIPKDMQDALFLNTLYGIGEINGETDIMKKAEAMARSCGLEEVRFGGPQIVTYDDGCSGVRWGSLFSHRELLNKK